MGRLIAVFIILLGVNFLLDNFGIGFFDVGYLSKLWPLVLIWLGWRMWKDEDEDKCKGKDETVQL